MAVFNFWEILRGHADTELRLGVFMVQLIY